MGNWNVLDAWMPAAPTALLTRITSHKASFNSAVLRLPVHNLWTGGVDACYKPQETIVWLSCLYPFKSLYYSCPMCV